MKFFPNIKHKTVPYFAGKHMGLAKAVYTAEETDYSVLHETCDAERQSREGSEGNGE